MKGRERKQETERRKRERRGMRWSGESREEKVRDKAEMEGKK